MAQYTGVRVEVSTLQKDALLCGIKLNAAEAARLYRHVKDRHLCVDALLMDPRPSWLKGILTKPKKTTKAKA